LGSPRVSVLLPVRNAASTLREALSSLLAQTLGSFEIEAVDDGSSDQSADILREAAATDPRVRIQGTGGLGIAAALNLALGGARGAVVARMDADDVAHPDRLAIQANAVERSPGIWGCRVRLIPDPEGGSEGMERYVSWQNELLDHERIVGDLFVESPLCHPSVMMPRDLLVALGGYRDFDGPEDYDLWLRAHSRGVGFGKVPDVLLSWRDTKGRMSRKDPRYAAERFLSLKLDALDARLRGCRGVVIWGAGPLGKTWSRALAARGHALLAFVEVDERKIGQTIHEVRVLRTEEARIPGALHIAAVGQPGARERIRGEAARLGIDRALVAVA
jgi:glycosyltransferase involved in cell wall biosynthesis